MHGPQTPAVRPIGTTHVSPVQQSALMVQPPQVFTQLPPPKQMKDEPLPPGLGTQGRPLQQSALDAHACPAATHCAPVQRGTPTLSGLQVSSFSQLPAQQSHDALHDIVASLQTSPFGLHPCGLRQTPSTPPADSSHAPLAAPQQSLSWLQTSPTTWQPLAGWQMSIPVGPYGAHRRTAAGASARRGSRRR